jgi:hypothetical protein
LETQLQPYKTLRFANDKFMITTIKFMKIMLLETLIK